MGYCRLVAGIDEWLFGEVLQDVRFKPADQRSSSCRPVMSVLHIVVDPATDCCRYVGVDDTIEQLLWSTL